MNRSIIISSVLHAALIFITAMSLPFLAKKPLDIPPIVSVELIQIAEKTNIPFAPKAKKIIDKAKEEEKKTSIRTSTTKEGKKKLKQKLLSQLIRMKKLTIKHQKQFHCLKKLSKKLRQKRKVNKTLIN